jgi:hypothetical protein
VWQDRPYYCAHAVGTDTLYMAHDMHIQICMVSYGGEEYVDLLAIQYNGAITNFFLLG